MQNLSSLINSLDSAKKTAIVADKFEITELTLTQQRKMIASIFDTVEAPAKLALAFNDIIKECVSLTNPENPAITVLERPFLLRALRDLIIGNTAIKVTKDEDGTENRTEYKFVDNDYSKFEALPKETTVTVDSSTTIHVKVPTLTRDNMVNRQLLDKLNSYRKMSSAEKKTVDGGQIAVLYFTFELIKYIERIDTVAASFKFEDLLVNEQLRVIDHLKTPVIEPIIEFIKQVKEGEKFAFEAINMTTGKTEVLTLEHTIFSKEI